MYFNLVCTPGYDFYFENKLKTKVSHKKDTQDNSLRGKGDSLTASCGSNPVAYVCWQNGNGNRNSQ